MAKGVSLLHSGRAKESVAASTGKTAIVSVVGPGEILGLSPILTGGLFGCTVEALEPTCVYYFRKAVFFHLPKNSSEFSQKIAAQLIRNCERANAGIRRPSVSSSAAERFARLLLEWAEGPLSNTDQCAAGPRILAPMTHEDISQCMASSRETMTRILGEFRKKKWIPPNRMDYHQRGRNSKVGSGLDVLLELMVFRNCNESHSPHPQMR
jgi:CRP/FNR family transcriptional regulator